jgi:DNA-nicking Smr family endonuclease
MKLTKSPDFFRPFEGLKKLLISKADRVPARPEVKPAKKPDDLGLEEDAQLFRDAMADVKPISGNNRVVRTNSIKTPATCVKDTDSEVMGRLNNLIKYGHGFIVADTPEYMEGSGYDVHPEVIKRLHQGNYSIQGHIDLHGLSVNEAREVMENFFEESIRTGKRAVLIVHGRGLSSPAQPILKTKVYEWLTRGPWRKWVIAFSSARIYDGGAGATYVLLRQRPLTKRFRK